jgi:sugar lactone lactonase YvrE
LTGLAVVPSGFGDVKKGSLVAAAGASGIAVITTDEAPTATVIPDTAGRDYVDLAFSDGQLFALDAAADQIDTLDDAAGGAPTQLEDRFDDVVGMAIDPDAAEILVADAGAQALRALPVAGGEPVDRAPYDFAATAPSGIAFDGVGTVAFVTMSNGAAVVRGSALPRIDPTIADYPVLKSTTAGYGDLEFDRHGAFLLVANDPDDPAVAGDAVDNFLFSVKRSGRAKRLESGIGAASDGEGLLSLAVDLFTETIYLGSSRGMIYQRTSDKEVSLLASVAAPSVAVLGLELAPGGFGSFGGQLIATTSEGEVIAIDPQSPTPTVLIATITATPSGSPARLSDLVFTEDGVLYVLDNGQSAVAGNPRVLQVAADGTVTPLALPAGSRLGQPDGIEIDEGGQRLLVATSFDNDVDQVLQITLGTVTVTPLANVDIDDAFFPTGIVYDRLGTAIVRLGDTSTSLLAVNAPLLP